MAISFTTRPEAYNRGRTIASIAYRGLLGWAERIDADPLLEVTSELHDYALWAQTELDEVVADLNETKYEDIFNPLYQVVIAVVNTVVDAPVET